MTRVRIEGARAVVLAGGEGTRLQQLTTQIEGYACPKQFCRLLGDESLLSQTRQRLKPLFDPHEITTVVTKEHEPYYKRDLDDSAQAVIVQPENRGTGIAIAVAILSLRELDSDAVVAAFPSDHYYSNEGAFLDVVAAGLEAARANAESIILVGAEATCPETEYGWIEPVQEVDIRFAPVRVHRFWEKPDPATADKLLRRRCLWNTFVTLGRVSTLVDVLCEAAPEAMLTLASGVMNNDLAPSYESVPAIDFSRDVLATRPDRLLVIRSAASGWTDVGNPQRVFATLAREGITPQWLESLHRSTDLSIAS
jgi:mannose-1-phosphate guanylyltransferase